MSLTRMPSVAAVVLAAFAAIAASVARPGLAQDQEIIHATAIAEFGEPKYGEDTEHWPFVNPDAPKGGKIVLGAYGSFDSLNYIILKGDWVRSLGLAYDSLMAESADELSVFYPLIAESVDYPADKSWIVFHLNPDARFHDGEPITAADVEFTWNAYLEHGRPFLKAHYEDVDGIEVIDPHTVKFTFKTRDSMKPLIKVASIAPWPKHYWETRDISQTFLEPPLGSGGYRIKTVDPGRSITYERVKDYWAADLWVNRGTGNFDEIRYDYYRDETVMFEAFKAGEIDFREENASFRWATGYDLPEVADGRIQKLEVRDETPRGIQGYMINLRRERFQDRRVREALTYLFDFEFIKRTLLFGYYTRINSYFPNSDFGASGPPSEQEQAILEPYADQLRPEVMTEEFKLPESDGSGFNRQQLREALRLFKEAGWKVEDGELVDGETGQQFSLEILSASSTSERVATPYINALRQAGIDATFRVVDTAQYQRRIDEFDFDLLSVALNFFPPPGPEQRSYFGSAAADETGSANISGIQDPVVDALIEKIIEAPDLDSLKATSRAMDRVLLWGYYVVPHYYRPDDWLAYWNRFDHPETFAKYSHGFPGAWWVDAGKDAELGLSR